MALPTRKYWPPRSKRFMEEMASRADYKMSLIKDENIDPGSIKDVHFAKV